LFKQDRTECYGNNQIFLVALEKKLSSKNIAGYILLFSFMV